MEPPHASMQALQLQYRTTLMFMSKGLLSEIASSWRSDLTVFKV